MSPAVRALAVACVACACSRRADEHARSPAPLPADPAAAARIADWRDDLKTLATRLPALHASAFFHIAEADWRGAVADLDRSIPQLDDAHIVTGLARLVAAIGDAHTAIRVSGRAGVYPLALIWFDDGIFVAGTDPDQAAVLGDKLVGIGTHSLDDVIAALAPLISRDNDAWLHAQLPAALVDAGELAGTDLAPADHATFHLVAADGTAHDVELTPALFAVKIAPPRSLPLHLTGPRTAYWNNYLAPERLLYLAYNACGDDPQVGPFAEFAASTLAFADQHPVDRFVIDLRSNQGGDSRVIEPLIDGLAARPALAGKVFAIIGMHTFSSAMLNAIELRHRLHATLVGGPTGGKPSGYGEVKTFELPHSKLTVQYSTKLFSNRDNPGDSVEPDVRVKVNADDWFSGRDPAMAAILATPATPAKVR